MKIRQGFLAGAASAGLLVATTFNIASLEGSSSLRLQMATQAIEIREGFEFGLLRPDCFRRGSIDVPIARRDFNASIQKVFRELDMPIGHDDTLFESAGIFQVSTGRRALTRGDGIEAMCRAILYLADQRLINVTPSTAEKFSDYQIPALYRDAFGYLLEHGVIKGYPDGSIKPERRLTNRETVYLVYRFYQQAVAGLQATQRGHPREVVFLDMPIDPYIFRSIQVIARAGGFKGSPLGVRLLGEQGLTPGQLGTMVRGILVQAGKEFDVIKLQTQIDSKCPPDGASRGQLAGMLGVLIETRERSGPGMEWPYADVTLQHPAAVGLQSLCSIGLQLGYPAGRCEVDEAVTRFEVIGVLEAVINRLGLDPGTDAPEPRAPVVAAATEISDPGADKRLSSPPAATPTSPVAPSAPREELSVAPKDDFSEFVAKMKAKQARIRALIERKRP